MTIIYQLLAPSKLPGARTTITWNPAALTTRMRNAVTKFITTNAVGRYSAGSWKIAKTLYEYCDLPYYRWAGQGTTYLALRLPKRDEQAIKHIREALQADAAVGRLGGCSNYHHRWMTNQVESYLGGATVHMNFYLDEFVVAELHRTIANHYAHRRAADNEQLLAVLHSDQEIKIGTFAN